MKKSLAKISDSGEGKIISLVKFALFIFTRPGFNIIKKIAKKRLQTSGISKQAGVRYGDWINARSAPSHIKNDFEKHIKELALTPKISIVIPASDINEPELKKSTTALFEQSYAHWELVVPHTLAQAIKQNDDRITYITTPLTNPAACINTLIAAATGDYILFLTPGDVITPGCLLELIKHINAHPADMLIYTDEDINDNGTYANPHFKPEWSPDTLLSRNYIGNNILVKKELIKAINGFVEDPGPICFYDFLLRATETTDRIGHIQQVLFHCAVSTFTDADNDASKRALVDAMTRRATPATINEISGLPGYYHINYEIEKTGTVSIIIPTKDNTSFLKTTIDSILSKRNYPDYEIIVLNNNSTSEEFFGLIKKYQDEHPGKFRCVNANFPFNFAKLMNLGVAESRGEYILMCNNDIEVISAGWLTQMVSYAQHTKIGAVGVKLLYPDNTIQHAGIVLGGEEASRHIYANYSNNDNGYCGSLKAATNYSAVTAACMMCSRGAYIKVGGMDENLPVEYNDIDFCLRLFQNGYYNLYLPSVVLYHYESATRGHPFRSIKAYKQHEHDLAVFKSKWHPLIGNDPFYNASRDIAFI